jgi:hypothetical protein
MKFIKHGRSFINMSKGFILEKIFRLKPNARQEITDAWNLNPSDAFQNQIRVCGTLIKSHNNPNGLFRRDELVAVYNPQNKKFVCGQVRGSGSLYKDMFKTTLALDYSQRVHLAIDDSVTGHSLELWKARSFEIEYFLFHQTVNVADRYTYRATVKQYRASIALGLVFATGVLSSFF